MTHFQTLFGAKKTGTAGGGPNHYCAYHQSILDGIPMKKVIVLAALLGLAPDELALRCGISRATFHRKSKQNGRLSGPASDVLVRHASILDKAVDVFDGDEAAARAWLTTAQVGLGGAVPLDLANTTIGYREVEKLLTRIDFGVYA